MMIEITTITKKLQTSHFTHEFTLITINSCINTTMPSSHSSHLKSTLKTGTKLVIAPNASASASASAPAPAPAF